MFGSLMGIGGRGFSGFGYSSNTDSASSNSSSSSLDPFGGRTASVHGGGPTLGDMLAQAFATASQAGHGMPQTPVLAAVPESMEAMQLRIQILDREIELAKLNKQQG